MAHVYLFTVYVSRLEFPKVLRQFSDWCWFWLEKKIPIICLASTPNSYVSVWLQRRKVEPVKGIFIKVHIVEIQSDLKIQLTSSL